MAQRWMMIGAATLVASALAVQAQQPPPAEGGRMLIVGENPGIDHKVQPNMGMGSPSVSNANFWRVTWSPVGPGTACFITVNEPTPAAQKFVITDNPKLAEYIASREVLGRLIPTFNEPAFKVIKGKITQKLDGNEGRTETCKGGKYTVQLQWSGGISEPQYTDFGFARQFGVIMTLAVAQAKHYEITINGNAHDCGFG
jgi:hypothetical protein